MNIRLKTKSEIETLREGGIRHKGILDFLSGLVKPGVSVSFLEDEALRLIKEGGDKAAFLGYTPLGAKRPFPAALCVSVNEEIVHGIPNESERVIREGDLVSLDLGLIHNNLITDSAVTVCAGECDDESKELLSAGNRALEAGLSMAMPGNTVGDIGEAVSGVIEGTGFSLAEDLAGHGVGYAVHEDPFVPNFGKSGKGHELMPGMVIAIEPMVNAGKKGIKVLEDGYTIVTRDGSRSVHFEHTVAITETGNIILTS